MKYLSDYTNEKQTEVFKKFGAFFAFSNSQFEKNKKDGVDYVSLGAGLIAPKESGDDIVIALDKIQEEAMKQDIAENGIKGIIYRELGNHECQITGDPGEVIEALKPYGITKEQIKSEWDEFYQMCIDNNYF